MAGDALLKMLFVLVAVLEDDWASTKDDGARALLRLIKNPTTPFLMATLDVLDHAVSFSCSSQSSTFGIFSYLECRRRLIKKLNIFKDDAYDPNVKVPYA